MRFDILTLFPDLFGPHLAQGVTRRAFEPRPDGPAAVEVRLWPLRDFADNAYRRVDDRAYGGGPGMVMMAEPLERALQAARADRGAAAPVVLFSPAGRPLDQAQVQAWARGEGAVLVCGRYEGVDQRFVDRHVDHEVSLGDFVLSGGEIPALALLDAVARLHPGVLGDAQSHEQDSFSDGLLDCPHYTRPESLTPAGGGVSADEVPPVLRSGDHARIARWRRDRALELTARRRPELIEAARRAGRLNREDEALLRTLGG